MISYWTPPVVYSKTSLAKLKEPHSITYNNTPHSAGLKRPITPAMTALSRSTKMESLIPVNRLQIKGKPNLHLYSVSNSINNTTNNTANNTHNNTNNNTANNS